MLIVARNVSDLRVFTLAEVYELDSLQEGQDFYGFLCEDFFPEGICCVWEENGRYVAALRLQRWQDGYLLEGLQTHPDHRGRGYAKQVGEELDIPSLCASFSAAVSDTLTPRMERAIRETGCKKVAVAGGVAANSRIRRDILAAAEKLGATVYLPPLSLCGDNAAMIGSQAYYEYLAGNTAGMELNAYATKSILGEKI